MKNDRLRWSFFKWRVDIESDVTSLWKTNSSNSSFQIDFVSCFFSFIQKKSARRVNVWMCVCVCLCVWEEMQMKSVVFEKSLFSVQSKDFCFLRSILELITRSLVNIKRRRRSLLRWQKFKYSFIQFYFNLNYYSFHFLKLFEIYLLCFVVLLRQNDRF